MTQVARPAASGAWSWLVLSPNADGTSFTTLATAPTRHMAVEIARALAATRTVTVAAVAVEFPAASSGQAAPVIAGLGDITARLKTVPAKGGAA